MVWTVKITPNPWHSDNSFNSSQPSDSIWQHQSGSTLDHIMVCCHWHQAITWTNAIFLVRFCGIDLRANLQRVPNVHNELENYRIKIIAISPRDQWVKSLCPYDDTWCCHSIFVNISSGNGLLRDDTKPLHDQCWLVINRNLLYLPEINFQ